MASITNLNTLMKVLLCAVLLLSTTVVVAHSHREPDCRRLVAGSHSKPDCSRRLAVAVVVTTGGRRMLGAAAYFESKRASPSGPDPQHH
ncbi:hypothetical protein BDA96_10G051300 [Sorghum bicolor]|jgi:hypothetical protein|uniref:Uncharacterized protein n=2 Tax=Sorghum bicolor TaxID=4558 RepID=A0A921PZ73_SORBI|nr:hypothetical protein BDA96_10G051300 [Sorghum bicolor]KXG19332.1 hypothetical protein SORBI_3010G043900 [Sorghum bicolor]